jgi:hypothetical protein
MPYRVNIFTGKLDLVNTSTSSVISAVEKTGTDCSGNDGETNRTLSQVSLTFIVVDNQFLHPTIDYTYATPIVTFINPIFNSQHITLWITT